MARYKLDKQLLFAAKTAFILNTKNVQPGLSYNGITIISQNGIPYIHYGSQNSAQAPYNLIASSIDLNNMLMSIDYVYNFDNIIPTKDIQDNCVLTDNDVMLTRQHRFYTQGTQNNKRNIRCRIEKQDFPIDEHYKNYVDTQGKIEYGTRDISWDFFLYNDRSQPRERLQRYDNQYVPEIKQYDELGDTPNLSLKYSSIVYIDHCYKDIRTLNTKGKNQYNAKVIYNDDNAYLHLNEVITLNSNREYIESLQNKAVLARTYYGDGDLNGTILSNKEFLNFGGFCNYYYDSTILTEYGYLNPNLKWFKIQESLQNNCRYTFINQSVKPFVLYVDHIMRLIGYTMNPNKVVINGYVVDYNTHKSVYCAVNKYFTVTIDDKNNEIHFTGDIQYDNLFEYKSDKVFLHITEDEPQKIEVCLYNQPATTEYLRLLANVIKDRYELHLLEYDVNQGSSVNTLINNVQNKITSLNCDHSFDEEYFSYRLTPKTNIFEEVKLDGLKICRNNIYEDEEFSEKNIKTQYFVASAKRPQTPLIYDFVFVAEDSIGDKYLLHYAYYSKIAYFKFVNKTKVPSNFVFPEYTLLSLSGNNVKRNAGELEHELNQRIFKNLVLNVYDSKNTKDNNYGNKKNRNWSVENINIPDVLLKNQHNQTIINHLPICETYKASGLYNIEDYEQIMISYFNYLPMNHFYKNLFIDNIFSTDSIEYFGLSQYKRLLSLFVCADLSTLLKNNIGLKYQEVLDINVYKKVSDYNYKPGYEFNKYLEYSACDYINRNNSTNILTHINENTQYVQNELTKKYQSILVCNFTINEKTYITNKEYFRMKYKDNEIYQEPIYDNKQYNKFRVISQEFEYNEYIFDKKYNSFVDILKQAKNFNDDADKYKSNTQTVRRATNSAVLYRRFFLNDGRDAPVGFGGDVVQGGYDIAYTPSNFIECTVGTEEFPLYITNIQENLQNIDKNIYKRNNNVTEKGFDILLQRQQFEKFITYSVVPNLANITNYFGAVDRNAPYFYHTEKEYNNHLWRPYQIADTSGNYADYVELRNPQNNYTVSSNLTKQILNQSYIPDYQVDFNFDGDDSGGSGGGFGDNFGGNFKPRYNNFADNFQEGSTDNGTPIVKDASEPTIMVKIADGVVQEMSKRQYIMFMRSMHTKKGRQQLIEQGKQMGINLTHKQIKDALGPKRSTKEYAGFFQEALDDVANAGGLASFVGTTAILGANAGMVGMGAAIGSSIMPGIGTAVGAVIGAIGAAIGWLFGGKKAPPPPEAWVNKFMSPFLSLTKDEKTLRLFHKVHDDMFELGEFFSDAIGTAFRYPNNRRVFRYTVKEGIRLSEIYDKNYVATIPGGKYKNNIITNHTLIGGDNRICYVVKDRHESSELNTFKIKYFSAWSNISIDQSGAGINDDPNIKTDITTYQVENTRTYNVEYHTLMQSIARCLALYNMQLPYITNPSYNIPSIKGVLLSRYNNITKKYDDMDVQQIFIKSTEDNDFINKMMDNKINILNLKQRQKAIQVLFNHILSVQCAISAMNNTYCDIPLKFTIEGNVIEINSTNNDKYKEFRELQEYSILQNNIAAQINISQQYTKHYTHNNIFKYNDKILMSVDNYFRSSDYTIGNIFFTNIEELQKNANKGYNFSIANGLEICFEPYLITNQNSNLIQDAIYSISSAYCKNEIINNENIEYCKYANYKIQNNIYNAMILKKEINIRNCVFNDANKYD